MILYKTCYGCQTKKELEEFGKHNNTKDKRQHYCKECARQYRLENKDKNKQYQKDRRKKNISTVMQYGITLEEYDEIQSRQGHKCALCYKHKNSTYRKKLYIDHCHVSGKIRGLLCQHCNTMLGFARDDKQILLNAVKYLTR